MVYYHFELVMSGGILLVVMLISGIVLWYRKRDLPEKEYTDTEERDNKEN
ncbi:MAG: hypothetical protein R1F52_07670 [Candidatus Nitrosoabyssus spongiisocia]|nr:MAG: hypothetical protein R1F52_07670 [Nitrosopumilaceae archaeon AB1(1)]